MTFRNALDAEMREANKLSVAKERKMAESPLVFCMKFIQNANKLISILYQIDTEIFFESNDSLLIHKRQLCPVTFSSPPRAFRQLQFVLGLQ